jgi:pantoate--beta-alanine ligase
MGALHAGHGALMQRARAECDHVVVSIFVNPLQFDRADDLDRYPRTFDADVEYCRSIGVDLVFSPTAAEMYPSEPLAVVEVGRVGDYLCGQFRPGHFRGVATVVLKLFNIVQPEAAYFGEKDAQQLAIVRRMVSDLNVPVEIVGVPTVREPDGLALSSRNTRLTEEERALAPALYRALCRARDLMSAGERDPGVVKRQAVSDLPQGVRMEYFEVVDAEEMQPVQRIAATICVAGAMWVGSTRLIDNIFFTT